MKHPNILVYMTDQQRADSVFPYNKAITPNVDNLAKDGVTFSYAYTSSPHCCPARATFFTGLYPTEHGVWNNIDVGNRYTNRVNDGVEFFPRLLKDAGYENLFSGKWHVSHCEVPLNCGFDSCYPELKQTARNTSQPRADDYEWHHYYQDIEKSEKWFNSKGRTEEGTRLPGQLFREGYPGYALYDVQQINFNDELAVSNGLAFIKERDTSKSFFAFLSPTQPHDPYKVPQKYLDLYDVNDIELPVNFYDKLDDKPNLYKRTRERFSQLNENEYIDSIRHYRAMCTYQDELFGRVVQQLKDSGEYDNTIIFYTSDHGDYCGEHGLFAKGLPCFEGAYHIPMIVGGGYVKNKNQVVEDFVCLCDMAPTILDIANITTDVKMSGHSFADYLDNTKTTMTPTQKAVYTQSNGNELYGIQRSVRTKKYKYVYNGFDFDELYDLEKDPFEMKNVINDKDYKHIVKDLVHKMWCFAYEHHDVCINPYVAVSLSPYGPGIIFNEEDC